MDNLPAHKVEGVRKLIEAAGAKLLYLPPYSPDLNPIELASPSSRLICAKLPSALCQTFGAVSARPSAPLPHKNALHSSATMAMPQLKWEML
jgi:hypothetical protein